MSNACCGKLRDKQLNGYRFDANIPLEDSLLILTCIGQKIVIELDGGQHQDQVAHDELRTSFLRENGWRVLRFWNNDVMSNLDGVLSVIAEALGNSTPTQPSPCKGEGTRLLPHERGKVGMGVKSQHTRNMNNFRQTMIPPLLVFGIGNESRGDDALAPLLVRSLEGAAETAGRVELIEDYQLQVEHVTDLAGRSAVLFVDADMSCVEPFHFSEIAAAHDHSYTSHAMTPFALLHSYRQVYGEDAPPAFLMRIRGYGFELGDPLSEAAAANLERARARIRAWLADIPPT